jgi:hypothetical protein
MAGTLANSASIERNFSSIKSIHSAMRNRLPPERINKLLFIHINSRVIGRELTLGLKDTLELDPDVVFDVAYDKIDLMSCAGPFDQQLMR